MTFLNGHISISKCKLFHSKRLPLSLITKLKLLDLIKTSVKFFFWSSLRFWKMLLFLWFRFFKCPPPCSHLSTTLSPSSVCKSNTKNWSCVCGCVCVCKINTKKIDHVIRCWKLPPSPTLNKNINSLLPNRSTPLCLHQTDLPLP